MIAIVDYGSGNIKALVNIYQRLKIPCLVASTREELARGSRIILPGVGAFDQTVGQLDASGLRQALTQRVLEEQVPVLGICVGAQLLAERSEEGTLHGLGWIDAEVMRFDLARFTQRTHLPHMGWNEVNVARQDPLFDGIRPGESFYFLHSYHIVCREARDVLAEAEYGGSFTCAVRRDNVIGVQFHPEKSHAPGIRVLENFASF